MLYTNRSSNFSLIYVVIFYVSCLWNISMVMVLSQENSLKSFPITTTTTDNGFRNDKIQYDETENKFFIKSNTIIRTGESRELGAKYLNETRMPSNHDCLVWCLETPICNAAVYEEKNKQSCYLFDCGSPAKPLCKFTLHNFFTSAILKMSQHSYDLSQWGKQMKQERIKTDHHVDVTSPVSLDVKTLPSSLVVPTSVEYSEKKGNVCHHYQFQCVNNSECIAIYNVCDGIPQCPDGSDESVELKCPVKGGSKVSVNINKPSASPHSLENKAPIVKEKLPISKPSVPFTGIQSIQSHPKSPKLKDLPHKEDYNERENWRPKAYPDLHMSKAGYQNQLDDSDGLGSPFIHKHSQFMAANDPHVQNLNRWASDYDPYPPHPTSLEQQYNPYDRMDDQYLPNQLPVEYDSVKGFNGYHPDDIPYWPNQDVVQDTSYTMDEFPQSGVQNMNKAMIYPDKENRESYVQQIARTAGQYSEPKMSMHTPVLNQPSDMDNYKLHRYLHGRPQQPSYLSLEESPHQRFLGYPNLKEKQQLNSMQNMDDAPYSSDDIIRASIVNQLPKKIEQTHHAHEYDMKQPDKSTLHHSSKNVNVFESPILSKVSPPESVKTTAVPKSIQKTVLDFKMSVAELYQSRNTHTHESNSAILALVVGIIISFLLIILLACRIRVLRRRMSRKGRALAHDADYLVNGMYL